MEGLWHDAVKNLKDLEILERQFEEVEESLAVVAKGIGNQLRQIDEELTKENVELKNRVQDIEHDDQKLGNGFSPSHDASTHPMHEVWGQRVDSIPPCKIIL